MVKRYLFLIFILLLFYSCSPSITEIMNSWIGHSKQELIMSFGIPSRIESDGAGGEIVVFAQQVYQAPSNSTIYTNSGSSSTVHNAGYNYWSYKMFFINKEGKIYHWLTQNQQIPPTQIDLTIFHK